MFQVVGPTSSTATWEQHASFRSPRRVILGRLQMLETSSRFEITRPVSSAGSSGSREPPRRATPAHADLSHCRRRRSPSTSVSGLSRARRTRLAATTQMWRLKGGRSTLPANCCIILRRAQRRPCMRRVAFFRRGLLRLYRVLFFFGFTKKFLWSCKAILVYFLQLASSLACSLCSMLVNVIMDVISCHKTNTLY